MGDGYGTAEERYKDMHRVYDEQSPFDSDAAAAVEFLAGLAGRGRALELAVGTGRIAIALAGKGVDVTGVDASPDMLRVLREKDTAGIVHTVLCDMTEPEVTGDFSLVYLVANGLCELITQEAQVRCLTAAARLLAPGGSLVLEAALPDLLFADRRPLIVGRMDDLNAVSLQAVRYDALNQIVQYRHIHLSSAGVRILPSTHRMVYLPELDLMAKLAGLEPAARHSDWIGGPFDPGTGRHISVYQKPSTVSEE
jgi:SAM-dependent methyltransferase